MKKTVIKAASICVLSAVLATGFDFSVYASGLGNISTAGVTAALDNYYISAEDSETVASDIAALTKEEKEIVSVVKGYTNLGVANVDTYLNIREEASEDSEIVGKLPKNAGSEVLEVSEDGAWYQIKSGKVTGYVKAEYLLTGEEANAKAEEVKTVMATVNTTTLKVRMEPSTDAKVLTLIPIEEELEVLEDNGEWVKVTVDSDEGFISKEFVDISYELPKAVTATELKYGEGVSDVRVSIVEYAKQFLGNPYVWGGTSLTNGADCSGFVLSILAKYGVSLPHSSSSQSQMGSSVDLSSVLPGDLIFYGNGSSVNHVAMYIGGGQVIHASSARTGIKISNMNYRTPIRARRFLSN
ncbi:C40 family peptidase [Konateibacter massiliensis]|uniref:C40 family peptidase n=1 Tax=Konateibacter massiliensis TaxID=2002841 RepID=UPI000C15ED3F|nr:C40 family peptidase [Konateibacter massiliensis]